VASNVGQKAEDATSAVGGGMKNLGTDIKKDAKDMGQQAMDTAKDFASNVGERARDAAAGAQHVASDVASKIGHKAEDATSSVGGGMKSLAGQVREHGPREGMLGSATSAVADTLEKGGRYLQEEGLRGIGDDLTNLIRRNPIPALLVGIGVGFLLARATSSRS
jgi:phage-related protein